MKKKLSAPLIPEYQIAILHFLRENGSKTPTEIEDFIRSKYQQQWTLRDRQINLNGIPQWRNDVHWARANLTRQSLIIKGAGKVTAVAPNDAKPRIRSSIKPIVVKETTQDSKQLFDSLTADILAALRKGNPPWRKPWGDLKRPTKQIDFAPLAIPKNAKTGKPYFGVNTLTLWNATCRLLLTESLWGTELTWWDLGAEIQAHASFTRIRYFVTVETPDAEEESRPIWHRLYNLAQVNGCDHLRENHELGRSIRTVGEIDTKRAWDFIGKSGAKVTWGGKEASYNWQNDKIKMPHKQRFESELDLLTVLFHELGHWTGHKDRLNRQTSMKSWGQDSPAYAEEELVAELTACFLFAYLEIPDRFEITQHAGYIKSYIKLLENDCKALRRAAGRASEATRFLLKLFQKAGK